MIWEVNRNIFLRFGLGMGMGLARASESLELV